MRILKSETSRYAVLLVILFCIAAVAARETITYFEPRLPYDEYRILAANVWALSLGFMLIAGAFGLMGIKIAAETEGTRRVGRVVDAMDYIHDGILLVDRRGLVIGSNPAARQKSHAAIDADTPLLEAFPYLSEQDAEFLMDREEPHEVERSVGESAFAKTLRFRSQPSANLSLVLISDVTAANRQRLRRRHSARLQLIGQIARGVTNDFSELLCAIAGNASILPRLDSHSDDAKTAIASIERNAEKGVALANHLRALADAGSPREITDTPAGHVRAAADILRDSLTDEWTVNCTVAESIGTVPLGRTQLEQLVLNLGLLVADAMRTPGTVRVSLLHPDDATLKQASFACLLLIGGDETAQAPVHPAVAGNDGEATGVIVSVIRSMLEETGSQLESMRTGGGMPLYRISLSKGPSALKRQGGAKIPDELSAYLSHWSILVAKQDRSYTELDERMRDIGVNVEHVHDVVSALGRIDCSDPLDAMILDERLLVPESKALVRAILKLRPSTALVVLSEADQPDAADLAGNVVILPALADTDRILMALIDARHMAVRRKSVKVT